MGFAKYLEDDIEIFNTRMYKKEGSYFNELHELKQNHKKNENIISPEEEYLSTIKELEKLEVWLNIIESLCYKIRSDSIIQILDKQKQQIIKIKDEYINHMYDPKFKRFKEKKYNYKSNDIKDYENKIIESYIKCFMEKLKKLNNYNNHDAIIINNLYWDIENFSEMFFQIEIKLLKMPLIKYLRENIIKDNDFELTICTNCGSETYSDFNNCIKCKYPKEVRK